MRLTLPARLVLTALAIVTVMAHYKLLKIGGAMVLAGGTVSRMLVALENPAIALKVGSQALVWLLAYSILFWIIVVLSRQRRDHRHPAESDQYLLLFSWIAVSWLILRFHSHSFPHSAWTWTLSYVQSPIASWFVDIASAAFLLWRFAEVVAWWWRLKRMSLIGFLGLLGLTGIVIISYSGSQSTRQDSLSPAESPPNVVLIGIDSMRRDILMLADPKEFPNIAALRDKSYVNTNVITPIARTFPAWVTILTGLGPSESGARANHAPQGGVRREASIAWKFRNSGYRTIYATDETRFSNIGPEFGFDQVVSPQMGVSDFVLGQFGDMPLANFLVQLPYAERLLPALAGNRAYAQAYRPEHFVGRLMREVGRAHDRPTFLAIHLCTPHWPYYTARQRMIGPEMPEPDRSYLAMLMELDAQLGNLLDRLREEGYLNEHTLLAVLADHGEALTADEEAGKIRLMDAGQTIEIDNFQHGHGSTLGAPTQWEVFTMFSGWSAKGIIQAGKTDALASLEDVAPALLRLAGIGAAAPQRNDVTEEPSPQIGSRTYVRMESGWRPRGFDVLRPNGSAALKIASSTYDVLADGRLEFKPDIYRQVVRDKELAVTDGSEILGLITVNQKNVLVTRKSGEEVAVGQFADQPGPPASESSLLDAACLWTDMRNRMPGWCSPRGTGIAETIEAQ